MGTLLDLWSAESLMPMGDLEPEAFNAAQSEFATLVVGVVCMYVWMRGYNLAVTK